jgi:AcrR family transcriptional regulator
MNARSLSRDKIVDTALRVADDEGLDSLTLRRLAGELGTGQASLYRHITDRGELLALLAARIAADFPLPDRRSSPRTRLSRQWLAAWDLLTAHPWVPTVLVGGAWPAEAAAASFGEAALTSLSDAGLGSADAARAYRALWHLLLGQLLDAQAVANTENGLSANEYPLLRKARPRLAKPAPRKDYQWALGRLLDGILAETER